MPAEKSAPAAAAAPEPAAPTPAPVAPVAPAPQPVAVPDLTVTEFCTRLSEKHRTPELIGAFHAEEVGAGHVKDTESAFASRFSAFANRPV